MLRKILSAILLGFLALIFIFPFISNNTLIGDTTGRKSSDVLTSYATAWDTRHYTNIALNGYPDAEDPIWAFFPMYPILLRTITLVTQNMNYSVYFLASSLFVIFWTIFFKFRDKLIGVVYKSDLVVYLPFTFFLLVGYTEALFSTLLFAGLYLLFFARKSNIFPLLILISYLISLTRSVGIVFSIAILLFFVLKKYYAKKNFSLFEINIMFISFISNIVGLFSFMYYGYIKTGNFFVSRDMQIHWGRTSTWKIWEPILVIPRNLAEHAWKWLRGDSGAFYWFYYNLFLFIAVILFFVSLYLMFTTIKRFHKFDKNRSTIIIVLFIVSLALFVIPLTSNSYESLNRFLAITPAYLLFNPLLFNDFEGKLSFLNKISSKGLLREKLLVFFWIICFILFSTHWWIG